MQTLTMEMAKGAGHLAFAKVYVLHEFDRVPCVLIGEWEDGARLQRCSDGKLCNWPVPFSRILISDEDAARCLQAYRNSRREVEEAAAFAQQPTSRQIGGPNDYVNPAPAPRFGQRRDISGQFARGEATR